MENVELLEDKLEGAADDGVGQMVAVGPHQGRDHVQKPTRNITRVND